MAFGSVNVGTQREDKNCVTQEQVGVAGGIATLGGDGKLTESQMPEIDSYTRAETDMQIGQAIYEHNSTQSAHPAIQQIMEELQLQVHAIELKYGTNVNKNPFNVTFSNLNDVVATGVWNKAQARIEF